MESWKIVLIAFATTLLIEIVMSCFNKKNKFLVSYLIMGNRAETRIFSFDGGNLTTGKIEAIIKKIVEVEKLEDDKEIVILNISNIRD